MTNQQFYFDSHLWYLHGHEVKQNSCRFISAWCLSDHKGACDGPPTELSHHDQVNMSLVIPRWESTIGTPVELGFVGNIRRIGRSNKGPLREHYELARDYSKINEQKTYGSIQKQLIKKFQYHGICLVQYDYGMTNISPALSKH